MIGAVVDPLIGEARARQRRRRRGLAALALVAAAGAAGGWYGTRGAGSGSSSPSAQAVAAARARIAAVARRAPITESGLTGGVAWAMDGYGLWISANGGRDWLSATPPHVRTIGDPTARINEIQFVDPRHGWVSASDVVGGFPLPKNAPSWRHMEIDRTSDGGRTWTASVPPGCLQTCGGVDVDFLDARRGFALTGHGFFATSDGGATWRRVSTPPFSGPITFLDTRHGFVVTDPSRWGGPQYAQPFGGGRLLSTDDGGRTWRRVVVGGNADSVTAFGSALVVPVRRRAHGTQQLIVRLSRDGGDTWATRLAPPPSWIWRQSWGLPVARQFSAATPTDWIVAGGALLHATTDAGRTWRTVTPLDLPAHSTFWEVHFRSAFAGWAIVSWRGLQGAVLVQTTDGGRWWTPLAPPVPKPKPLPKRPPVCGSSCYRP